MEQKKRQTYNDGVLLLYHEENQGETGETPVPLLKFFGEMRFQRRTVGIKRFYEAKQFGEEVSELVRIQKREDILAGDIVSIFPSKTQYRVTQIQHIGDVAPPSIDLTLVREEGVHDISAET